jgi:hypothetical protein
MTIGDLRSPIFANTNLSVVRKFGLGERANLNLHVDATNLLNRSNFQAYAINGGVSSILSPSGTGGGAVGQDSNSGFGTLSMSFLEPRQITVSLHLDF